MRFSANRALTLFKQEGERTEKVEEYIQYTRHFANEILKQKPDDEEAQQFINFPESLDTTED